MPVSSTAAAAAGAKRKRSSETKYYAVRVGRSPGVYLSWDDCMGQIKVKTFPTLTDAEKFVAGQDPRRPGDLPRPTKFYAVKVGRVPGIYNEWEQAQKQIKGAKAPKHRCFATREEAENWMNDPEGLDATGAGPLASPHWPLKQAMDDTDSSLPPATKKTKKQQANAPPINTIRPTGSFVANYPIYDGYEAGVNLPPGTQDGFDTNLVWNRASGPAFKTPSQRVATKLQATGLKKGMPVRIYTDGSSLRNGQRGGFAGVGVYFGPSDARNISEPLPGNRQTNQRAELTAIVRALDTAPKDRDVVVVTDSEYSINCATKWAEGWRNNGWKTSSGKAVENRDLVESILMRVDERMALGSRTMFEWIKGHANHLGNVEADKLAVNAARMAATTGGG